MELKGKIILHCLLFTKSNSKLHSYNKI